jgi:hypothetical protein
MIRFLTALIFLATQAAAAPAAAAPTAAGLIALIAPAKGEQAWLSIPWETDLTAARKKAAAENKPIFLWEMDGHPLGCT